jgi:transposase-like protein
MTVNGQRLGIDRPRVRAKGGAEAVLESYQLLNAPEALAEPVMRRMVRGVSTRDYAQVIDAFKDGYGVSKSMVSRTFIKASEKALANILARDFKGQQFVAIFIDGVQYAGTTVVVAVGITAAGDKLILGLREGATENSSVVSGLLADIRDRGVPTDRAILFVIDGSKALRKGIKDVWGELGIVQRCQVHKKRNVRDHLQEKYWDQLDQLLKPAWGKNVDSYPKALKALQIAVKWLQRIAPDAARSLEEGLEETITVTRLKVPKLLKRTLGSTNLVESALSVTRTVTSRVKRWRDGSMRLRWCAAGLLHAEGKFRKVQGHKELVLLIKELDALANKKRMSYK